MEARRRLNVVSGSSAQLAVVPSIGWRTGQSATQKRPSVRAKRVANPPSSISTPKDAADAPPGACGEKTSADRLLDASSPENSFAVSWTPDLGPLAKV